MLDVIPSPNVLSPNQLDFGPRLPYVSSEEKPQQPSGFCVFRCSFSSSTSSASSRSSPCQFWLSRPRVPEERDRDLAFIKDEDNMLAEATAPWFATSFFAAATTYLLSTNLRILDWVSRLTADSLKGSFLGESQFCFES
jgi:hypothetical protein